MMPVPKISVLILLSGCLLLCACAAEWHGGKHPELRFARRSTPPESGAIGITPQDLHAGDILFSSESSVQSFGIRLFSRAAVSHVFIYLGGGRIAEAVGSGVRIRSLNDVLNEANHTAVFRRPDITDADAAALNAFSEQLNGTSYNYLGIAKQGAFSLTRNACELPVLPRQLRRLCLNSTALVLITPFAGRGYFCSQFVVESFNRIGKPLTAAPAEWVNPSDLLHMREGDVQSVRAHAKLQYVGHLGCTDSLWNTGCAALNKTAPDKTMHAQRQSETP